MKVFRGVLFGLLFSAPIWAGFIVLAQSTHTTEDDLNLQIVILKSQLAQAVAATAKCEADGPQAGKLAQDAQTAGQALVKSLDARGLMIDTNNKIVAKPPAKVEATKQP